MSSLDNFRLVVFRTVAEQHSFRKAAEELYLTQPTVSLQIKALEEDVCFLFSASCVYALPANESACSPAMLASGRDHGCALTHVLGVGWREREVLCSEPTLPAC
jgi:hypothetical protein